MIEKLKRLLVVLIAVMAFGDPFFMVLAIWADPNYEQVVDGLVFLPIQMAIVLGIAIKVLMVAIDMTEEEELEEDKFPVLNRRLTSRDEHGNPIIREEDIMEAITYLCEVEDYVRQQEIDTFLGGNNGR